MHNSQYVTNQSMHGFMLLVVKFFSSSHDENHEVPWLQNPMAYKCSSFLKKKMNYKAYVSGSQYACEKILHWCALAVTALKTILIYV